MSFRPIALAVAAAVLLTSLPSPVAAQEERATLTGRVTDGSGGALPGVTVTITAATPGPAPVSVVTDGVGQYLSPPLAPGSYTVTFSLSGFAPETRSGVTLRASDVFLLDAQLQVAQLTESVQVVAANPIPPPPPPVPPVKLEAPRRPTIVPVPKEVLASVCGPGRSNDGALSIGKLIAHRDEPTRTLYGNGDVLVLDVGADIGLVSGQNLVVRPRGSA